MLEQKADDTMLKFMKDLQEVRHRWISMLRARATDPRPAQAAFPCSFMGTSFVGFSRSLSAVVASFRPSFNAPPVPR